MNAAARVVSSTRKYDRGLRQLLRAELLWLDVADWVTYIQALHGGAQVSSQQSDGLRVRAVHAGRPNRQTTAPSFGQPPPTRRVKNTARYVWPSCVRRV